MKLARIMLVAVFLLSAAATSARASTRAVGFVPLLNSVDLNVPIQMQMQDALNRLLPRLIAAQKRGEILDFSPSFTRGILKLVYRSTADTSALFMGKPVFSDMQQAAASMHLPTPARSRAAAPGSEATVAFDLYLFDNWVDGYNLPAGAHVLGTLKDKTGRVVSVLDGYADGIGYMSDYFSWNGSYADVVPGFTVSLKVYNGAVLFATYQVIAPSIRFTSIDKANSILYAAGPANKPIWSYWYHRNWNAANGYTSASKSSTSTAAGTWAVDFGAIPFRGHDSLTTGVQVNNVFGFYRYMSVPYIYCEIGYNACSIYGFPSTPAALQIVHAGTPYNFAGRFSPWGYFSAALEDALGEPIFLVAGDKASGTGAILSILPPLTAAVNYTTDVISGKAPANKFFYVQPYVLETGTWYYLYAHADALGNYATDFTSQVDLKPLQPFTAEIYVVNPATGNTVIQYFSFAP